MRSRHLILALALAAVFPVSAARAVSNFNFDADTPGTATTFSDISNGLTATFSSTTGNFTIFADFLGGGFSGNILVDPGTGSDANIPLIITFSQPVHTFDFIFATQDFVGPPTTLHVDAYLGASLQGSFNEVGAFVGSFPQGTSGHGPGYSLDKLILTDTGAAAFAIDSLTVTPDVVAVVPLPSSATSGLALLTALALTAAGKRLLRRATPTT